MLGTKLDDLYNSYVTDPALGLQQDELGDLLQDWATDEFREVPEWVGASDEELYGGMNPNLKDFVLWFDQN